ncbi:MAG: glucosaminidase domain-containing protein, partial [Bacilli bacterium]
MKKITSYVLVVVFLVSCFCMSIKVSALTYNRDVCSAGQYEVVTVKSNNTLTNVGCYGDYNSAKTVMENHSSTSTEVASIIYKNELIDTKYGLLNLRTKSSDKVNTNLYKTATTGAAYTYTNGYYGSDAAYLGLNIGNKRAKLKISGFTGWVRKEDGSSRIEYEVIPISLVKSPTYYIVSNGDLRHYFAKYITSSSSYISSVNLGPAPKELKAGVKYYSFDGNYFYSSLLTMLNDYKNNTYVNSINAVKAYYNYYQFLPYRTKSTYNATDINGYLTDVKDYVGKATSYPISGNRSMMYGEGANFVYTQNTYGANALLTVGISANESGWGKSRISVEKNNLFGHGAADSNPYGGANGYNSVRDSILYHTDIYVNSYYCDTETDYRYYGCFVGNKNAGMNVKYASDPYWGEKAAGHYYAVDKALGLGDYNSYQVGIKITESTVNVRKSPTTSSSVIYGLNNTHTDVSISNMPVVILDEVTGENIDGNNIWYKIQTDGLLDSKRNAIRNPFSKNPRPTYNWNNNYGYVHSSTIVKLGDYQNRAGMYYFNSLTFNSTNKTFDLSGFLVVKGVNNYKELPANYSLILINKDNDEEYILPLDRWTSSVPFSIPSEQGLDYTGAWFKGSVDLSSIPQGDYEGYIRARISGNETTTKLRNVFVKDMERKVVVDGRGYQFRINYYEDDIPIELFIRDNDLIASSEPPTIDNMFVAYSKLNFNNNKLNIKGTSFNVG